MSNTEKLLTISMWREDCDPDGVIWTQRRLGEQIKAGAIARAVIAHLGDLEDGESCTITFTRTDMTKAEISAIPEV